IPPVLTATATVTDAICNGSCDGSAIASANNGTSPFTYSWSNGQTGSIATGLCAGTYSVTVTDVSGTTATATVIVNEPIALAVSVSSTDETSSGANDGTATATGSGATSPYSYSWSNGATTSTISGLAPNTYNVTVTDTNGCTSTGSAVVNAAGCALSTTTSTTDVSCNGGSDGSAVATTIGGSSYTYNWSDGQTTQTATGLAAGTYSVTVTEVFDGCTDIVSITVNEPTALSLSISSSDETAPGANDGSATVTASGGTSSYSYSWNNGATTSTISGLAPGTYTVTVTDAASCTDTASVTVGTVGCTFTVAATSTDATCNGGIDGSVDITPAGTSPYTYSWSNGATIGDLAGVGAGTYNVTVADAAGCTGTASAIVSEPTAVTVTTSSTDETTSGANDGTATATGSGGTSPYTYTWSNSATTQTISGLSPGIYMVTVTDANGCTGNGVAVVNLAGCTLTVTASSTDETVAGANDGTATATAANGTTPYSYDWIGVDTTQTITGLAPGVYNVVVTDAAGCLSTASVTINAGAVGIEESTDNTAFSIYPNPASSELFIASSIHTAKLLIFDMTGKNLNEIAINEGINKLNVSAYSKGMYVYALVDADKNILQMGKFIISR
ncbi:T9SS type A sorting domain-containing protein, partial [Bacteroidales bacterium AH-315-I05]|nr:T9SS type A sorting domain-containing protein [Bacteroidales bacterium AH-315-I05]